MIVEDRLTETLRRRAESVAPSPDGWHDITRRIDRRTARARTGRRALVAGLSVAVVTVAVVLVRMPDPRQSDQDVTALGRPRPASGSTTTTTPSPAASPTTTAGPTSGSTPARPGPAPGQGTTVPGSGPPVAASTGLGVPSIWPETQAEIDEIDEAVAKGHQPWRLSPESVVSEYLADRGIGGVGGMSVLVDDRGEPVAVRYSAGGAGGVVELGRTPRSSAFYVTGARSDRIVRVDGQRHRDRLTVEVVAATGGTVTVRAKRPGTPWGAPASSSASSHRPVALTVDTPSSVDLIVQVRHVGDDGHVGLFEGWSGGSDAGLAYEALHSGSVLEFGGLGPVRLGASFGEAERRAGVPMADGSLGQCRTMEPVGGPNGVTIITFRPDPHVDLVRVGAPGVRTAEGIGVGSTAADVLDAYPGAVDRVVDGEGRLVHRSAAPGQGGHELVFSVSGGTVTAMWSGHDGFGDHDEICL